MVYKFDPDGHGKIIAEARDPRLDSLLGHHYPSTDFPQRARELYLRTRLRVLVDVNYEAAPLVPRQLPGADGDLDMSLCHLRSMSPLHLQYLQETWAFPPPWWCPCARGSAVGLIACHHYAPRNLRFAVRATADLLAEVASTRIAAIENYAYAQVAIQVRRLEQRLVEATSTEGDWRVALFRNPRTLLQPLDATGAALFYEGEVLTAGETPSAAELRELMRWIESTPFDGLFNCASVERANPSLDALTPDGERGGGGQVVGVAPRLPHVVSQGAVVHGDVGRRPDETDRGQRPACETLAAALFRRMVRDRSRHCGALVRLRTRTGPGAGRCVDRHHRAGQRRAAPDRGAPARADSRDRVGIERARGDCRCCGTHPVREPLLFPVVGSRRRIRPRRSQRRRPCSPSPIWFARSSRPSQRSDGPGAANWRWTWAMARAFGVAAGRAGACAGRLGAGLLPDPHRSHRHAARGIGASPSRDFAVASRCSVRERPAARRGEDMDAHDVFGAIMSNASLAAMDITDGNMGSTVVPLLEEIEASTRRAAALYSGSRRSAADLSSGWQAVGQFVEQLAVQLEGQPRFHHQCALRCGIHRQRGEGLAVTPA